MNPAMAPANRPRLIVNADDFGLSRGVSDAIASAHKDGILTSASIMANQPASEYAIELLRELPNLGIGIHLNLSAGRPILPAREVRALIDQDGNFLSAQSLARRLWRFQVSGSEIEAEFRAQIRWLKDRGVTPLHADSHLHIHLYPAALRPFARAVQLEGIRCVRAPRCTVWPSTRPAGGPHEGSFARRLSVQTYRNALQATFFRTFVMPHSRVSFHSAQRREHGSIGRCWIETFNHLPTGEFELTCHPGLREAGFSEMDRIAVQREEELRCLTRPAIREAVDRNGIELIHYSDLLLSGMHSGRAMEAHAA